MTHNKIIRLLTITGALLTATVKAQETEKINPGLGVYTATEQDCSPKNYIGLSLQPNLTWETAECKLGYYGSFYREENNPGDDSDWLTSISKIQAENDNWAIEIGRANTQQYAGLRYTPTTSSFDNLGAQNGTTRNYTGAILTHKNTGLSLGQVASDGNLKLDNLDQTVLGWAKELTPRWAIQLQAAQDEKCFQTGATIKWQPEDTTTVITEGFLSEEQTTALLTASHKLTDNLNLFGGIQMTWKKSEKPHGLATAGASYNLGHGLTLVTAAQQEIGADTGTTALAGIKYSRNFR